MDTTKLSHSSETARVDCFGIEGTLLKFSTLFKVGKCFEMHDEKCHHTLSIPAWEARRETEGNYIMGCNIGKWDDCSTLVAFVSFVCWRCVRVSVEMN